MIKKYLKEKNGMTLIECMIAIMIASVIMLGAVTTFLNFYDSYFDIQEKNLQATVIDGVTELLSEELRYATVLRIQSDATGTNAMGYDDEQMITSAIDGITLADGTSLADIASDQTVSLTFRYYPDQAAEDAALAAQQASGTTTRTYVLYVDILVESTKSDNFLTEQIAIKMLNMERLNKGIGAWNTPSTGNILRYSKTVQTI